MQLNKTLTGNIRTLNKASKIVLKTKNIPLNTEIHLEKDILLKTLKTPAPINIEKKILTAIPIPKSTISIERKNRNNSQFKGNFITLKPTINIIDKEPEKCKIKINTLKMDNEKYHESNKAELKESIIPFCQESIESTKKNDDNVLIGSQEFSINIQTTYPEEAVKKYQRKYITKRSPFSEIVDEGIYQYLGNNCYVSNKAKSSNI